MRRVSPEELGWGAAWAEAFAPYRTDGLVPARVAAQERDGYMLYAETGEWHAVLAGRLRHHASHAAELPVTGDWVATRAAS
jgi:ribosome biogenesis GTPase